MPPQNVYQRKGKMGKSDNSWLPKTPAKSAPPRPSYHICDEVSIILAPLGGDNEIATEGASLADPTHHQESVTIRSIPGPLQQCNDLDAKSAELLPNFGISTPAESTTLRPSSHVCVESSVILATEGGNNEITTEGTGLADPIRDKEPEIIVIVPDPLPQSDNLNVKPTEPWPSFDIPTPAPKSKKRKNNEEDFVGRPQKRPKKKVYWPKVKGQMKRRKAPKALSESKIKRTPDSAVDGKGKLRRARKPKSSKKVKESSPKVDEGKVDVSCCELQPSADKHEVEVKLPSSLEGQITSRERTISCKRSLKFELGENLEESSHMQNGLDQLGWKCSFLQISRKRTSLRRSRICPLLVRIRKMKLNFPKTCKRKRIQKLKSLFQSIKKGKRSNNRRRRSNLYDVPICNQTSLSKQGLGEKRGQNGMEEKREEKHGVEDKKEEVHRVEEKMKVEPIISIIDRSQKQQLRIWEFREETKAQHNSVKYLSDEDNSSENAMEEKGKEEHGVKGKRKRKTGVEEKKKMISTGQLKVLIKRFQSLDINDRRGDLVPFKNNDSSLVLHKGIREGQRIRVRINLDEETLRIWNLLMDGKGYEENEENRKYWEHERNIYLGRVKAFNARMHLILGNRRFTPWKGSILDSVIGVFLTQNVSDHLSSSAYMSLAATFPIKTSFSEERKENLSICDKNVAEVKVQNSSEVNNRINILNLKKTKPDSPGMVFGKKKTAVTSKKVDEERKKEEQEAEEREKQYWESLRRIYTQYCTSYSDHANSVDWEAVRCAEVSKVAKAIEGRGQHNIIAQRIQALLNKLVEMHGSIDLEWLRYAPPIEVKEYLLKVYGLGLKSVECIRLLALQHKAFPVDVNVGRIAVRLGWVPLEPLPESIQIHLLDQYPIIDMVQQYLWPRLCTLDQPTLYELHYQLITFGKVFCTKRQPNCNACPMRGECRHFASAFASAKLALPGPTADARPDYSIVRSEAPAESFKNFNDSICISEFDNTSNYEPKELEPVIEFPASPNPEYTEVEVKDMEDFLMNDDDSEEFMTIKLNVEESMKTTYSYFDQDDMDKSKALVALTVDATFIPMPKLKNVSRLRTERLVYVLPDTHPVLIGFKMREVGDPSPYLLVIWTREELKGPCESLKNECNALNNHCFSCNNTEEENNQTVSGTVLIPCRTAMDGRFPLNGTYFQVNEVFVDADSCESPIEVPRNWIWNLQTQITYFGTSTSTILRGLSMEEIHNCFWRGFVCVRGFDRKTGAPRPLSYRFHRSTTKKEGKKNVET